MVKITLQAIERENLKQLQKWRNSKEVMSYCRQYRPLSMKDMLTWYEEVNKDSDYNLTNDLFVMVYDNTPIGVGGYTRIDWRNRKAELSFYVGENTYRTEKIISEALLLLVDYAFKTLGLHKIYFPVYSFNPYLPIYEKILQREYTAKEEYYWESKWHDRIILSAWTTQDMP